MGAVITRRPLPPDGNHKSPPAAERGSFLLQLLLDALQVGWIQLRTAAGQFGDELVAVARQCNENEIGIQHRDQRGNNAGADLTHSSARRPAVSRARPDRGYNAATH
jgi:hypothetical protein